LTWQWNKSTTARRWRPPYLCIFSYPPFLFFGIFFSSFAFFVLFCFVLFLFVCSWGSGEYRVTVDGVAYTDTDGSLRLSGVAADSGSDALGSYTAQVVTWQAGSLRWQTAIRLYAQQSLVFEQTFLTPVANASAGNDQNAVSAAFPTLRAAPVSGSYGFYQFAGHGVPATTPLYGAWPPALLYGGWENATGALAIFDASFAPTAVLSPLSAFMAQNLIYADGQLTFGLQGMLSRSKPMFSCFLPPREHSISFRLCLPPTKKRHGGVGAGRVFDGHTAARQCRRVQRSHGLLGQPAPAARRQGQGPLAGRL
jgi:hypothetical protein